MKENYVKLIKFLEKGGDIQMYSFSQIETIIGERISPVYLNKKTFKWSSSRFQKSAMLAGFVIEDVDYENKTIKFVKNGVHANNNSNNNTTKNSVRSNRPRRTYRNVESNVSSQSLDPNDIGKDLIESVNYLKNQWRTTGDNPQYVAFRDKYNDIAKVYYNAGDEAYRASVRNRIPLFEGMPTKERLVLRRASITYLAEQFRTLFSMEEMNFEIFSNWEYEVATKIRQIYHDGGVRLYTYGNAQKLINVALKFVLSSDIVDYNNSVFKYCFFPIDGIIQKKLKSNLAVDYLHLNGENVYYQPSWARCDNWADILDYQTRVREAVLRYGYYSPIIWEATHWN